MVAHIATVAFQGISVTRVDVQVQVASGLPAFTVVGLPDKAVAESRERVRAALNSIGLSLPPKRIVVNLAPADLLKEGSHFDLPIAVGLLVVMGIVPSDAVDGYMVMGELSLDGGILKIPGVLPASIEAAANDMGVICPEKCGTEAAWAGDLNIIAPGDIVGLINHFKGTQVITRPEVRVEKQARKLPDMRDIKGQEHAKRALEIAAAGGHNMLMMGPPGSGKSMLASRLSSLLPPLSSEEILEVSMIASVSGRITDGALSQERPYREPHHSTSMAAMVGGGKRAYPGEISLAHRGVLFLDELPEFSRDVLEALRQPLETGKVTVARANNHITYPARFQLVAAMNPCRCGYIDDPSRACNRAPKCAGDYQSRISGPLFDRFDIFIDVPALKTADMGAAPAGETTAAITARVARARSAQQERLKERKMPAMTNAEADGEFLAEISGIDAESKDMLMKAVEKFKISMRGYNRIIRVARTIADLDSSARIAKDHLAEAIGYRHK